MGFRGEGRGRLKLRAEVGVEEYTYLPDGYRFAMKGVEA